MHIISAHLEHICRVFFDHSTCHVFKDSREPEWQRSHFGIISQGTASIWQRSELRTSSNTAEFPEFRGCCSCLSFRKSLQRLQEIWLYQKAAFRRVSPKEIGFRVDVCSIFRLGRVVSTCQEGCKIPKNSHPSSNILC